MNEIMIRGLIGDENFTEILIGLPDEFFKLNRQTQDVLWKAVLVEINDGRVNIKKLIAFGRLWLDLYLAVKSSVHRATAKL